MPLDSQLRSRHASSSLPSCALSSHMQRLVHGATLQESPPRPTYLWVTPTLCGSNTVKASPKSLSCCPTGRWACPPFPPRRPKPGAPQAETQGDPVGPGRPGLCHSGTVRPESSFLLHCTPNWGFLLALNGRQRPLVDKGQRQARPHVSRICFVFR